MTDATLDKVIQLTRTLAEPERQLVIIGEGNTSLRVDDDSFWIKASGQSMVGIDADGFVQVRFAPILDVLDQPDADEPSIKSVAKAAVISASPLAPSIEVTFHAALLADCGVHCIAHTHPVAVNQILCSTRAEEFAVCRLFPDEIVLCGPRSVYVPYTDPGLPLARAIRAEVRAYLAEWGEPPKVILLGNHGLIALGMTTTEALNVTAMCVKAAAIFWGAALIGDPVSLSPDQIRHIYRRPDEIYRRQRFVGA